MWGLALYALEPPLIRKYCSSGYQYLFYTALSFKNSKTFTFGYSIEIANFYFAK